MWTKRTTSNAACWFAFLGVAYFAIGALSAGQREEAGNAQTPKKADTLPALLKARLDVAKKGYGLASGVFGEMKRQGPAIMILVAKPEEVYSWSVRWLNAERDMSDKKEDQLAALTAHLQRMKELRGRMEKLGPAIIPEMEMTNAAWYVAEAEVWLAKAK